MQGKQNKGKNLQCVKCYFQSHNSWDVNLGNMLNVWGIAKNWEYLGSIQKQEIGTEISLKGDKNWF